MQDDAVRALGRAQPFLLFFVAAVAVSWADPTACFAQGSESDDDAAHRHFVIGQANYANGGFETAAAEFDEAYRLSQRPALLYNVYVAHRDAGHRVEAASALRRYLELVPDAENAASLRARLEVMEAELAEASAPDEPTATEASPSETPAAPATTSPSPVGWIVGGVGVAAMIAGVVTGVLALDAQSSLNGACGPSHDACPSDFESTASAGRGLAAATDGLLIGGGVLVATGVVLLFTLVDETADAPPVTAACDATGCSAFVHGRF